MEKYGDKEIYFIIKLFWGYLQKVGCNKKYKNVLNSVIIDYFVHYQMFLTIISYTNTTCKTKKGYAGYTVSGVLNSKLPDSAFTNLENFSGIQQQKQKECN